MVRREHHKLKELIGQNAIKGEFNEAALQGLRTLQSQLDLGRSPDRAATPHMQPMWGEVADSHRSGFEKDRRVTWAKWNYNGTGHQWPKKTYKEALLEAPPGLQGGQKKRKPRRGGDAGLQKALKEHWDQLPEAFRNQCTAL